MDLADERFRGFIEGVNEPANFHDFINPILESSEFNWFGLLGYVLENAEQWKKWEKIWGKNRRHRLLQRVPATAQDCFRVWREELGIDCLWLEQERLNGDDVRFYVLVADWWNHEVELLSWWKEISKGWAHPRPLVESFPGFFGHMVMRKGCTLGVDCGGVRACYYTSKDFIPWKPKPS
jgi:hypothetical protein